MQSLPGGGGPDFVDVERREAIRAYGFSKFAREWNRVCNGISIDGLCLNRDCVAFNEMVDDPWNFKSFDLLKDKPHCPMCHQKFKPVKPIFSNCIWRIVGEKPGFHVLDLPWREVGHKWETYDEVEAGMSTYVSLTVQAYPLDRKLLVDEKMLAVATECRMCKKALAVPDVKVLPGKKVLDMHTCCYDALPENVKALLIA
jgi:hypothetical protein